MNTTNNQTQTTKQPTIVEAISNMPSDGPSTSTGGISTTSIIEKPVERTLSSIQLASKAISARQQGFFRALIKVTRQRAKATHHIQLLTLAIDNKRPPRGLLPRVSVQIPEQPLMFTVNWEEVLYTTGLKLTQLLLDFWQERIERLSHDLSSLMRQMKATTTEEQWTTIEEGLKQVEEDITQEMKRKKPKQKPQERPTKVARRQMQQNTDPIPEEMTVDPPLPQRTPRRGRQETSGENQTA